MPNNTVYKHGVYSTISGDFGKVQNISIEYTGSTDTGKDELGSVIDYADYDLINKVSCTILLAIAKTPPNYGDLLTITPMNPTRASFRIHVDSVKENEENEKMKMIDISGTYWKTNALPANA